ncbi:4Fe-4S binding protein [Maledivibacter halophilus]|uniref:Polyferredoxin n=1 Tax=Maledivibacter halophilus TaxID=36842 RepID=A0A1T5K693_9FIRM|nr:4Fe-4S binding protein [Maledivibacter halophilus]SKC59141.1 Polyferredoxin [Maledivibacter halophilus]
MKRRTKKKISIRTIMQVFFFILIAIIAYNHYLFDIGKGIKFLSSASVHAICPFGGIESIYQYLTTGTLVKKIHESSIILMYISFLLAVLFGPVLCGWVCPLGSIQEWFGKIGKKIFKSRFNKFIPYKYDRHLRFLRYFVLIFVIYMTATSGDLIFNEVDPYSALFHLWSSDLAIGGLIVLIITLTASLFVERPWCKYACPYGALLGITNSFRIFKIRRNSKSCISCNKCDNACPMNIKVSKTEVVKDHQCISCMKCTSEEACPIGDTVEFTVPKINQKEVKIHEN